MTGTTIFLAGGLIITNLFVAFLLVRKTKREERKSEDMVSKGTLPAETKEGKNASVVGKSKFDISEYEDIIAATIKKSVETILPVALSEVLGDVKLKDVEFAASNEKSKSDASEDESAAPAKTEEMPQFRQLDSDETEDAFNTDLRDMPSAPSASGSSIDEMESAVDTALNPDASESEKAAAGVVLSGMQGTEAYDRLTANDEISRRIDLCIQLSVRAQIKGTHTAESPKQPLKTEKVFEKKVEFKLPDNIDDFDPSSILG